MDARTTTALLYLNGVNVSFDGFRAINNLSLAVEPGEMRAIIGPNGAGKTTMMDIVTGKTRPDDGDVFFEGSHDLSKLDETEIATLGIGRKFQKPTVFEMHTVEDNLLLALKNDRRPRATLALARNRRRECAASPAFSTPSGSAPLRSRLAGSLAHGQKQWLEIGMLLAQEPKLLLVDEPVAGMTDAETQQTARAAEGNQSREDRHRRRARHDVRPRTGRQGDVPARRHRDRRRHDRPGVGERARDRSVFGAIAMLDVQAIDLHYGAAQALRGVSLQAKIGEVTCVLGRNGVGKTSLLDALGGPAAGERRLDHVGRRRTRPGSSPTSGPAAASPMCRKAARSFRC